jgi:hypothetical protein
VLDAVVEAVVVSVPDTVVDAVEVPLSLCVVLAVAD